MIGRIRSWLTETRASDPQLDYTGQLLAAQLAAARGFNGVRASGAYVAALNIIESSTAIAELSGDHAEAIMPHIGTIARSLADRGESNWLIEVDTEARLVLLPCSVSNVYGTADPATWTYQVNKNGPSETLAVVRPASAVLSFRAHIDPKRPWRGRPALEASNSSGALLAALESQMAAESRFKPARAVSAGVTREQRAEVSGALAAGGVVTISGSPMGSRDSAFGLQTGTIKNESTAASVSLHGELSRLIFGILGVPPEIVIGGSEAGGREAFRRFAASTITPIMTIIQREFALKVSPLIYNLSELRAGDISARSRAIGSRAEAFKNFVDGGVSVDRALKIAGLND